MRFSKCYCFLLHGYMGMFDYWFKNGRKEPPKEMDHMSANSGMT